MERIGETLGKDSFPQTTGPKTKSSVEPIPDPEDIVKKCKELKARDGYSPNPHCWACHGFGRVYPLLDSGRPDYSRFVLCEAKGCEADQKREYESTASFMVKKGVGKYNSFDNFLPVDGALKALEAFQDIAGNPNAPPLLLIYGTTGNGKTHLCEAVVIKLISRGIDCWLWTVAELVGKLKESISDNTTERLMGNLKTAPALIFDDWGQNYGSDWEVQKLEEIVIARERAELMTIITTNLELDKFPERVISRFRDRTHARIILNAAGDYRPKKKTMRKNT